MSGLQDNWLTVEVVEELHRAIQKGRPVASFVSGLRNSTLPALLEYGCLRWSVGGENVPQLPDSISQSELGRALQLVPSPLGFGTNGAPRNPLNRIDVQSVEFIAVSREEELDNQPWELFTIRFARSAQSAGFSKTVALGLVGALCEMTRNAMEHANAPTAALVGYQATQNAALFCVVDVGIGVLASLKSCRDYQNLSLHVDALRTALRDGTSRHGQNRGGLGFREVFKSLASFWGHLRFRSGEGGIAMIGNGCGPDLGEVSYPPHLPGFQVTVCCRRQAPAATEPPLL